jgi:hypothetical protein
MFQHSETGNVAFVDSPEQAEKFGKENPRWIVIPLCAATPAQPEPTVEANSQNWAGMDGAVAWHLIDRHADNWADVGKMMDEWLAANTEAAVKAEREACAKVAEEIGYNGLGCRCALEAAATIRARGEK